MIHPELAGLVVPIESVHPHPDNPRRGHLAAIKESLEVNGQYRPIVASARDHAVLAGNHTYAAAAELGWEEIAVVWVDVDEEEARRILLADNRHSDLATYDSFALVGLLHELGSLEGTGFDTLALQRLEALFDTPQPLEPDAPPAGDDEADPGPEPKPGTCMIGLVQSKTLVDCAAMAGFFEALPKKNAADIVRERLRFPLNTISGRLSRPGKVLRVDAPAEVKVDSLRVPIASLVPHPENARQGDVGAISESLAANGQFRPLVVNKSNNEVLAGNHTLFAARVLGWDDIAVTYVDVGPDEARRILLADNRTADLGGYDVEGLADMLGELSTLEGTGFSYEDLDALERRRPSNAGVKAAASGKVVLGAAAERITLRCDWDSYSAWLASLGEDPLVAVAETLGIPVAALLGDPDDPQDQRSAAREDAGG